MGFDTLGSVAGVWIHQRGEGGAERSDEYVSVDEVKSALDSLIASGACHLDFSCEDARLAVDSGGRNWCLVRYSAPRVGAWVSFNKGSLELPEHTIEVDGRVRSVPASWAASSDDARAAVEDFIDGATRSGRLAWVPYA